MANVRPFSDEQMRLLVNLRQRYDMWIEADRLLAAIPYDLRRKSVSGRQYLYEIFDAGGNGKSLGPLNEQATARLNEYRAQKAAAKQRREHGRTALAEASRLYRALRLPLLSSDAGPILREADRRDLLGSHLLVVGTNAMSAYMVEAAGFLDGAPGETEDFDLAWSAITPDDSDRTIWSMLKAVDPTFAVNSERDFQARNAKAYEVEILVAPSRAATMSQTDQPRPIPLPEQEWLLLGTPVDQVVGCRDGSPARIVAPDPRWFALHKLWMADQAKRNPLKRTKDRKQGIALLNAVAAAMPQYPLDRDFERQLPVELAPYYASWAATRSDPPQAAW